MGFQSTQGSWNLRTFITMESPFLKDASVVSELDCRCQYDLTYLFCIPVWLSFTQKKMVPTTSAKVVVTANCRVCTRSTSSLTIQRTGKSGMPIIIEHVWNRFGVKRGEIVYVVILIVYTHTFLFSSGVFHSVRILNPCTLGLAYKMTM